MTPAKFLALSNERIKTMALYALPIDRFSWMYFNAHRDPGEAGVREPAPFMPLKQFLTFERGTLAAKDEDPEWDYSLQGAKADQGRFIAWAKARTKTRVKREEIHRGRL